MSSSTPPETTSATGAVQENASTAASSSVARGGLIEDYDMSSARPAVAAARTNWNVEDGALRPLPPLHPPLDPASTAFVCDASPSVIAARVSDCLRERSIMTEFDDDAATAQAVTSNRVHFVIRLYRGGGPNSSFSHGVIVEVQRLRGDAMTFHQSTRAILSAAQGSSARNTTNQNIPISGMGLTLDNPVSTVSITSSNIEGDDSNVLMALEIDWGLIKKDRMDANILGWESLALLTNPESSGRTSAIIASRVVLGLTPRAGDTEEDERFTEIHASIISLVRDRRIIGDAMAFDNDRDDINQEGKNDADYMDDDEIEDANAPEEAEHIVVQRSLAIRSLANALEVLSSANDPMFIGTALPHLVLEENIIPSLLDEVAQSVQPNNPFNASDATNAARALSVLFEFSEDARNIARGRNASAVLSKARLVGSSRHAALESQTARALSALSNNTGNRSDSASARAP
eukprot:CAMPEP_0178976146 /NCGR_PEP_ID=MMETSP0789-20121207/23646_1 /TAXON_ID=3005 /ORGANISM="Rhizosolenia setigera, Strain CCMP 1694" /LENGTH=461 /DNA_ID=CAMNT_0020665151 /DNA_START=133 /DNA_END=1518 /DNA_ORIENTATION=-